MASLRARLLAGLLALTAAGMLLAGGITYAEQQQPRGRHGHQAEDQPGAQGAHHARGVRSA